MMKDRFIRYIREHRLAGEKDRILLAVSGGIDSMVMAHLFLSSGYHAGIAHCNFKLRGSESDKDEALVESFSSEYGADFYSESFNTSVYAEENGISIQMAARELRYNWFEKIRNSNEYDSVAIAHNLNDNIETFLINLTRGTGISGLTGMKPRNDFIIRPLLFATRQEIASYQASNGIPYREDMSNSDIKYTRNKIRHNIIPLFREINPSFDNTILETASRFADLNEVLAGYFSGIQEQITSEKDDIIIININKLKTFPSGSTIIFELFRKYGIGSAQVGELKDLINARTGAFLNTRSHRILKNRDQLLITPLTEGKTGFFVIDSYDDLAKNPFIGSVKVMDIGPEFIIPDNPGIACVDESMVKLPLVIRKWQPGDSFYPLGMNNRKKLSDYLIDKKLSVPEKENCYVMETDGNIIWIVGDRIDNRFRIRSSTHRVLIIEPA